MRIDTKEWKSFYLKNLFNIQMGNGFDKNKLDEDNPEVNLVSRVSYNNGVDVKVGYVHDVEPFKAGLVTVALGGSYLGSCFVQEEPFYTGQNVAVMEAKYPEMSHGVKTFITGLVRFECKTKYYAFGRELNTHIRTDFDIKLPIQYNPDGTPFIDNEYKCSSDGYVPDWKWMEDYIKSLRHKPITTKNLMASVPDLNICEWKEFRIGKMFDIHPTKDYKGMSNDELNDGGNTPFVINSAENNAIGGFSTLAPTERGNIITFSDTTEGNTFFYQPDDFIGFAHVQGMYPLNHIWTEAQMLFLSSVLMFHNKGLFSYGRKMRRDIISNTVIKLPIQHNLDGTPLIDDAYKYSDEGYVPDWKFMEDYIKLMPYGDRL